MVGRLKPFGGGGFGGADVHAQVDLAAVGVYNFATEPAAQLNSQFGLAYSGGSDDGDRGSGSNRHIRSRADALGFGNGDGGGDL